MKLYEKTLHDTKLFDLWLIFIYYFGGVYKEPSYKLITEWLLPHKTGTGSWESTKPFSHSAWVNIPFLQIFQDHFNGNEHMYIHRTEHKK